LGKTHDDWMRWNEDDLSGSSSGTLGCDDCHPPHERRYPRENPPSLTQIQPGCTALVATQLQVTEVALSMKSLQAQIAKVEADLAVIQHQIGEVVHEARNAALSAAHADVSADSTAAALSSMLQGLEQSIARLGQIDSRIEQVAGAVGMSLTNAYSQWQDLRQSQAQVQAQLEALDQAHGHGHLQTQAQLHEQRNLELSIIRLIGNRPLGGAGTPYGVAGALYPPTGPTPYLGATPYAHVAAPLSPSPFLGNIG
jgi:hypothetical protein